MLLGTILIPTLDHYTKLPKIKAIAIMYVTGPKIGKPTCPR